ncbi:MAG: hydrogenase maturation nickel metallochaperone HypA [Nevskia sp.]|nr:hydrogenase maturation nickel metallochaperone HypA [Nevskia sp.]
MHESGIVRDLVRRLLAAAREAGAERVSGVTVWLGALSQFSAVHFREHFDEEAQGTAAQGAALHIEASDDTAHPQALQVVIRSVDLEVPDPAG